MKKRYLNNFFAIFLSFLLLPSISLGMEYFPRLPYNNRSVGPYKRFKPTTDSVNYIADSSKENLSDNTTPKKIGLSIARFNNFRNLFNQYYRQNTLNILVLDPNYNEMASILERFTKESNNELRYFVENKFDFRDEKLNDFKDEIVSEFANRKDLICARRIKISNPNAKIHLIGDIHGNFSRLLKVLNNRIIHDNFKIDKDAYLVFTGDYVDRGCEGLKVLFLLMKLKLENWNNVFLIRGNHEICVHLNNNDPNLQQHYNFIDQISSSYISIGKEEDVKNKMETVFKYLPIALIIEVNGKRFEVCHGAPLHVETLKYFINNNKYLLIGFLGNYYYVLDSDYIIESDTKKGRVLSRNNKENIDPVQLNSALSYEKQSEHLNAIFRGHTHNVNGFCGGIVFYSNGSFMNVPYKTNQNLMDLFNIKVAWPKIFTLCSMFTSTYLTLQVYKDVYLENEISLIYNEIK